MIRDAKGRLGVEESRVCCARRGACADSWPQELADDILATLFLFAVAAMYAYSSIPVEISGIYFVAIAITFVTYAFDKSAARHGARRTQESVLHLMSLVGGWPGGLVGQQQRLVPDHSRRTLAQPRAVPRSAHAVAGHPVIYPGGSRVSRRAAGNFFLAHLGQRLTTCSIKTHFGTSPEQRR